MSDRPVPETGIAVTPQAALWVSSWLTVHELRRKPLDREGMGLAAGLANADDPLEHARRYWEHVEARGDSPRDELLSELRQHSSYSPELESALRGDAA